MIKMSTVQKKSSKSAKKKNTSQAKLVQTNECPTASASEPSTSTSSSIARKQKLPATNDDIPSKRPTLQYHQEFGLDEYFSELRKSRVINIQQCKEIKFRCEITALQTKIDQGMKELANVPSIWNVFQRALDHAEEEMGIVEELENVLSGDYLKMVDFLKKQTEAIQKIIDQTKKVYDKTIEGDKLFEQKYQQGERALDDIKKDIQFATKTRDNLCIQIAAMNEISSKMNQLIDDFQKSNSQLKTEICAVQRKFEDEERAMNTITNIVIDWMREKSELVSKLTEEKLRLKNEKKQIHTTLTTVKSKTKSLCAEVNKMKIESDKMEKLVSDIQNANKNLRDAKADRSEFNQRRDALLEKINKITEYRVALEEKMAKEQKQHSELMQVDETILKKQQIRSKLQQKLAGLKNDKWKQEHKISIMQEYINETKSCPEESVATDNHSKRERLSRDSPSDSYSFNSKDFRCDN